MYPDIGMNHTTTTTVLIAIAAVTATLLAAGTIAAAVGGNHSVFAHHKKDYKEARSNGISHGITNKQIILCITYGNNSPIYGHACSALLNLGPSPMKQESSYTPSASQQSSPMKQESSYTPSAAQQSSPMKESTSNLSGSYPSADRMKSSNTNPENLVNTWDSASDEFPFG